MDPDQLEQDIAEQAKKDAARGAMTYRMEADEVLLFQRFKEEQEERKMKEVQSKVVLPECDSKVSDNDVKADEKKGNDDNSENAA